MTIPGLIVKNQEKELVVQLKNTYNILSNAFDSAKIQYGSIETWSSVNDYAGTTSKQFYDKISPFLNIAEYCGEENGCFANVIYKTLDGAQVRKLAEDKRQKVRLANGTSIRLDAWKGSCDDYFGDDEKLRSGCGTLVVDVNGNKGPNQYGRDTFYFHITKYGIIPAGAFNGKEYIWGWTDKCGKTSEAGLSCTAWVLLKGNMDYPKGPVGWD